MHIEGNTVLITGGSEGIGFEMARALAKDNTVIICGRNREKLEQVTSLLSNVHTEVCDITDPIQRRAMVGRLLDLYPELNIL